MDDAAPIELGWVLVGEAPEIRSAIHALRHAPLTRTVALSEGVVCVQAKEPLPELVRARVERRLGRAVEARADCDVARYPLGRGYVLILVEGPAEGLEAALDAERPMYREVVRPSTAADPVRICLPNLAVGDPLAVVADLRQDGYAVSKAYEIGGCRR